MEVAALPTLTQVEKVKRSCNSCTASKVKCSGTHPCTRCVSRKIDCFYRPRKKRIQVNSTPTQQDTTKKQRDTAVNSSAVSTTDVKSTLAELSKGHASFLQPHEKRAWVVFFSLYRNYNAGCARFWFERQFARIKLRLERAGRFDMLDTLRQWSRRLDIDYDAVQDRGSRCLKALADPKCGGAMLVSCGGLHLHVDGKIAHCCGSTPERVFSEKDANRPRLDDLFVTGPGSACVKLEFSGTYPEDYAMATVNSEFEQIFGLTQKQVNDKVKLMGSGLLPWGGDFLALLAPNEADVFAFMQVCAISLNWSFLGRSKDEFPLVREVPSAHVFPLSVVNCAEPVPCLVKCVHREHVDFTNGIQIQISLSFEPLMPVQAANLSSGSPTDSTIARELPIADDDSSCRQQDSSSAATPMEDVDAAEDAFGPDDILFPDLELQGGDDDLFFQDLLEFARISDARDLSDN